MQAFLRAAEGIRTLDLLHGKQCGRSPAEPLSPCKSTTFRLCSSGPFARLSPANHGSLWTECGPEALGQALKLRLFTGRRRASNASGLAESAVRPDCSLHAASAISAVTIAASIAAHVWARRSRVRPGL